jgi:hypothetical protein
MQDVIGRLTVRRRQRDVPVLVTEGRDVVRRERLDQRAAELTARARYDDAASRSRCERIGDFVLQRCTTRESFQGISCSSGSDGSYSSVTW